ncbi:hypothetical protein PIIN_00277 [Serendipita indica DSM 11827]|uniref:Uncharacterized protein n=1 Tax=Serendipita indica (strain DSM 11827) TaxID=1109443 RepID=G4T5H6_SERID|nr:hypothetical protein PIIN_00277 [Serendipita indica DSM 11827]
MASRVSMRGPNDAIGSLNLRYAYTRAQVLPACGIETWSRPNSELSHAAMSEPSASVDTRTKVDRPPRTESFGGQKNDACQLPPVPSEEEAKNYYYGLPSEPRLVARSNAESWYEASTIHEGPRKVLSPFGPHPLFHKIWDNEVVPTLLNYLNNEKVNFTSLDPVRIGYVEDAAPPAILWIGVVYDSLAGEAGVKVANDCRDILLRLGVDDIHVEIRESEIIICAKPEHPGPVSGIIPPYIIEPLSTTIGRPISTSESPDADLQAEAKSNFKDATTSGDQGKMDASLSKLEAKRETIAQLDELLERFTMEWGDTDDRVIGSVAFAPPINLGQGQGKFTEDWTLIELDKSKFDEENFVGNKMNLLAGDNTVENIRKAMAPDDTNRTTLF